MNMPALDTQDDTLRTFNPVVRAERADALCPLRHDGWLRLTSVPREAALALAARFNPLPTVDDGPLRHYETTAVLASGELRSLALSPAVLGAAAGWLGCPPVLSDVAVWRSVAPVGGDGAAEGTWQWHRDLDDWRACKLFVMLSDVGDDDGSGGWRDAPGDGAHEYVPGSHRLGWFAERGEDAADEARWFDGARSRWVQDRADALPRVRFTGAAGTAWLECTYGLHRGTPPAAGRERLVFQACYTMREFAVSKGATVRAAWGR